MIKFRKSIRRLPTIDGPYDDMRHIGQTLWNVLGMSWIWHWPIESLTLWSIILCTRGHRFRSKSSIALATYLTFTQLLQWKTRRGSGILNLKTILMTLQHVQEHKSNLTWKNNKYISHSFKNIKRKHKCFLFYFFWIFYFFYFFIL